MQVSPKVNFEELARSTDEFNGAQLKVSRDKLGFLFEYFSLIFRFLLQAVCVEAGMIALREGSKVIGHEHYLSVSWIAQCSTLTTADDFPFTLSGSSGGFIKEEERSPLLCLRTLSFFSLLSSLLYYTFRYSFAIL